MTNIFKYLGSILKTNDGIATNENCCCGCGCYKIDYNWDIIGCQTLVGSVLVKDFNITCYNDTNAVSVTNASINYGPLCSTLPGSNTIIVITCSNDISTIVLAIDSANAIDVIQLPGNICCGAYLGQFVADSLTLNHTFSMNISFYNGGVCDCSGYTPV